MGPLSKAAASVVAEQRVRDLIDIAIARPGRASATPCKQGNKQPVVWGHSSSLISSDVPGTRGLQQGNGVALGALASAGVTPGESQSAEVIGTVDASRLSTAKEESALPGFTRSWRVHQVHVGGKRAGYVLLNNRPEPRKRDHATSTP
jgi:hypothetical protein